jgi:hypothetical protein
MSKKKPIDELLSTHRTKPRIIKSKKSAKSQKSIKPKKSLISKKYINSPNSPKSPKSINLANYSDSDSHKSTDSPKSKEYTLSQNENKLITSDIQVPNDSNVALYGISNYEALALGIGDPDEMSHEELVKFFDILGKSYEKMTIISLQEEAKQYLLHATAQMLSDNAMKMSHSTTRIDDRYFNLVKQKVQDYSAEMQNASDVVENAIGKFELAVVNTKLTSEERKKFQICLDELKLFQNELEKNGVIASQKKGVVAGVKRTIDELKNKSPSWTKTALLATTGVLAAALVKKFIWDHSSVQKLREWITIPNFQVPTIMLKKRINSKIFEHWVKWTNKKPNEELKSIIDNKTIQPKEKNEKISKILVNYFETSPNQSDIKNYIDKQPSFLGHIISSSNESVQKLWNTILHKIEPGLDLVGYYPAVVNDAYKYYQKNNIRFDILMDAIISSIKPTFFTTVLFKKDIDILLDQYLLSSNKSVIDLENYAMIYWFTQMPYNVEDILIEKINNQISKNKISTIGVSSSADIHFSVEEVIINWLYHSPLFGNFETDILSDLRKKQDDIIAKLKISEQKDSIESKIIDNFIKAKANKPEFNYLVKSAEKIKKINDKNP